MKSRITVIVLLGMGLAAVPWPTLNSANAALLTYDGSQQGAARADGPYTIGSLIRVGPVSQVVTHLGAQDADAAVDAQDPDGADGLTGYADDDGFFVDTFGGGNGIQVGLWTGDGVTQLASVLVTSSDQLIGSWRYAPIPGGPLTLQANTDYLIGALVGGGIEWFIDGASFGNTPFSAETGFSLVGNRFAGPSGILTAPTSNGGGAIGRWGAANAILIPEPATLLIWSLLAGLGVGLRWRRRK